MMRILTSDSCLVDDCMDFCGPRPWHAHMVVLACAVHVLECVLWAPYPTRSDRLVSGASFSVANCKFTSSDPPHPLHLPHFNCMDLSRRLGVGVRATFFESLWEYVLPLSRLWKSVKMTNSAEVFESWWILTALVKQASQKPSDFENT